MWRFRLYFVLKYLLQSLTSQRNCLSFSLSLSFSFSFRYIADDYLEMTIFDFGFLYSIIKYIPLPFNLIETHGLH